MKKTHDYVHRYRGYWSDGGRCRIRIYQEGHAPVVICSELPENDNTSVTNLAEYLAAEVMQGHPEIPRTAVDPDRAPFVWVEHYPRDERQRRAGLTEEWDLVTFSDYEVREVVGGFGARTRIGPPEWRSLDRAQVEELVGGKLDGLDPHADTSVPSTGECRICGRALSHPVSVQRSMGPVCAARNALPPGVEETDGFCDHFLTGPDYRQEVLLIRDGARVYTNVPHIVTHHSPSGYEWGYPGSGPADLALNIVEATLRDLGHDGDRVTCWRGECSSEEYRLHQDFKWEFLAGMPRAGGAIPWDRVLGWVRAHVSEALADRRGVRLPGRLSRRRSTGVEWGIVEYG